MRHEPTPGSGRDSCKDVSGDIPAVLRHHGARCDPVRATRGRAGRRSGSRRAGTTGGHPGDTADRPATASGYRRSLSTRFGASP